MNTSRTVHGPRRFTPKVDALIPEAAGELLEAGRPLNHLWALGGCPQRLSTPAD